MSDPLAKKRPAIETPKSIVAIRFSDHGRTGRVNTAVRELHQGKPDAGLQNHHAKLDEDPEQRGVWIDERILVPWSNLLWVEYS
jgi:hypothetical protein